ncbi:MAG TPA: hypothetical protein VFY61_19400, partial [Pyrinomonadaceae bacterium]|nr:hypothetical protein [Pyrinomonadaceae bacterium]
MIYYLLYELLFTHFKDKDWYLVKALNVFQYVTFRTAYATITALLISLIFGGKLIEWLRRLKVGQQIREEGPQAHMVKRGTPTMGGVLIVGSVLISTLLWARLSSVYVWTAMIATLLFAFIGFLDDYSKMAKKQSLGLTGRQKLLGQLLVAVGVWAVLFVSAKLIGGTGYSWNLSIPFIKATADPNKSFIGPYLYLVLIVIVLLGSSNAVNLTD